MSIDCALWGLLIVVGLGTVMSRFFIQKAANRWRATAWAMAFAVFGMLVYLIAIAALVFIDPSFSLSNFCARVVVLMVLGYLVQHYLVKNVD